MQIMNTFWRQRHLLFTQFQTTWLIVVIWICARARGQTTWFRCVNNEWREIRIHFDRSSAISCLYNKSTWLSRERAKIQKTMKATPSVVYTTKPRDKSKTYLVTMSWFSKTMIISSFLLESANLRHFVAKFWSWFTFSKQPENPTGKLSDINPKWMSLRKISSFKSRSFSSASSISSSEW